MLQMYLKRPTSPFSQPARPVHLISLHLLSQSTWTEGKYDSRQLLCLDRPKKKKGLSSNFPEYWRQSKNNNKKLYIYIPAERWHLQTWIVLWLWYTGLKMFGHLKYDAVYKCLINSFVAVYEEKWIKDGFIWPLNSLGQLFNSLLTWTANQPITRQQCESVLVVPDGQHSTNDRLEAPNWDQP